MDAVREPQLITRHDNFLIQSLWTRQVQGTPAATVDQTAGGFLTIALAAADEAQTHRVTLLDQPFRIADLISVEFEVACAAALPATVRVAFGLCETVNNDATAIAEGIWFSQVSDGALLVSSTDGTTVVANVTTGETLGTTFRRCRLNFRDQAWLNDARDGGSVGGVDAIGVSVEQLRQGYNQLRPVARGTRFGLGAGTGPFHPFFQIHKTGGVHVTAAYFRNFRVTTRNVPFAAV